MLMIAIGAIAQSSGVTIFKPATPKQVMVRQYIDGDIAKDIQAELSKGWILKTCSYAITQHGFGKQALVVYEKY